MSRSAWSLFAAGSLLWGLPYLFIKIALDEFSPWAVVWLRCLIAALVLIPLALHKGVLGQVRGRLGPLFLLALIEVTVPFSLISAGEQHISSSLSGLLIAALPLFVAVLAIRLDPAERVSGLRLGGLFIGMAGVAAVLGFDLSGDRSALLGAAMVLAAAFSYAFATFVVKRSFSDTSALAVSAMAVSISAVVLAPLGLMGLPGRAPSAAAVSAIVVLGLFCTAAGLLVYFALITIAGPSRATVITYLNPAVAVVLGVTVLRERLTAAIVAGFLLILLGSWLSTGGRLLAWSSPGDGVLRRRRGRLVHRGDDLVLQVPEADSPADDDHHDDRRNRREQPGDLRGDRGKETGHRVHECTPEERGPTADIEQAIDPH